MYLRGTPMVDCGGMMVESPGWWDEDADEENEPDPEPILGSCITPLIGCQMAIPVCLRYDIALIYEYSKDRFIIESYFCFSFDKTGLTLMEGEAHKNIEEVAA